MTTIKRLRIESDGKRKGKRVVMSAEYAVFTAMRNAGQSDQLCNSAFVFFRELNLHGQLYPDDISGILDWSKNPRVVWDEVEV